MAGDSITVAGIGSIGDKIEKCRSKGDGLLEIDRSTRKKKSTVLHQLQIM
jgi:hypothetical protein